MPVVDELLWKDTPVEESLHVIVEVADDLSHQSVFVGWVDDRVETAVLVEMQTKEGQSSLLVHPYHELSHQLLQLLIAEGDVPVLTAKTYQEFAL